VQLSGRNGALAAPLRVSCARPAGGARWRRSGGTALLFDGPEEATTRFVLAHGAGAPMDSPWMERVAREMAERGWRVARFEFPYMARRRAGGGRAAPDPPTVLRAAWMDAVESLGGGSGWILGGKSLGGRIASVVADEVGARGLVCLGYPFHPPGRPERTRTAHLAGLRTPGLIVQGTRDPFGRPDEVSGYVLSPSLRVVWIEDGDHDLRPRARSGRSFDQNLAAALDAVGAFAAALE
jgi:predicted alpha/beta-hydrolase family hydrolase